MDHTRGEWGAIDYLHGFGAEARAYQLVLLDGVQFLRKYAHAFFWSRMELPEGKGEGR